MHEILRLFASKKLSDSSGVYLRLAQSCSKIIDEIHSLSIKGSDGFIISLLMFDVHKDKIKQSCR
jgi:hypothetical protein